MPWYRLSDSDGSAIRNNSISMIRQKAFTLVEVIAAMAVLTVGLLPVFQMASLSIRLSGPIQNTLVAAHLSQEGIEVMRAARDNAWLGGTSFNTWADGVVAACGSGCRVQWNSNATLALSGDPALQRDNTSGLYQYSTGSVNFFHRTVSFTKLSNAEVK